MKEQVSFTSNQASYVSLVASVHRSFRGERRLDVRHATCSAFKAVKVGQVAKSRRYSSEPHDLSAAWAKRLPWRLFI
jgi:hypothetical protein